MKKLSPPLIGVFLFSLIFAAPSPAKAAFYTWTNTSGGNWNVAANWSPNGIPGASDTAAITTTGAYTVTVSDTESISTLTLGASSGDLTEQTLNLPSGMLTVNNASAGTSQGTLNVSGGTLASAGSLTLAGPLNWTGGQINGAVYFNGGNLNGGLNLYGALINSGTLHWDGILYMYGGVITNLGKMGVIAGSGAYAENGSPDIDNDGQFNVSGSGSSSLNVSLNVPFNNNGTVLVNGGALGLSGGGTENNSFTIASDATLSVSSDTFVFNSGCIISGAGDFAVSSGTANFLGTAGVTARLNLVGGILNLSGSSPLVPASVNITGGTEEGSQPLQITNSGAFSWTGGQIDGSVYFNGGTMSGGLNLYGALINSGPLAWDGTLYMYGGVITNLGTMNVIAGSGAATENGSPDIDNDGQFNVSGSGSSSLNVPFNNNGTVSVSEGTLGLVGGGTENNSFTIGSGATLSVSSDTFAFNSGCIISGAGNFTVSSGTANFLGTAGVTAGLNLVGGILNLSGSSPLVPASANITGGTEEGGQPLQVTNSGAFSWTGGQIDGSVYFNGGIVNGGLNLYGALINSGTLAWDGTLYMYGGVITNLGTVNVTVPTGAYAENGAPNFDNNGQFNVSGSATAALEIPFNNNGTVAVNSGTLTLSGGGAENNAFTVAAGSTLGLAGGTITFNAGSTISAAGNLTVTAGTANFSGSVDVMTALTVSGGTANFYGSAAVTNVLDLMGGTLNLSGSNPITPASANISGGTELGSQLLQVTSNGGFSWTGGQINGSVYFNGGTVNGGLNLYGALVNSGTLAWDGALYMYGGVFTNLGTINLAAGTGAYQENGSPNLDNAGQFNLAGPGVSTIGFPFVNTGTVNIPSNANLTITGPYTSTNGTLSFGINSTNSFGSLTLSGPVDLNGTLDAVATGYSPNVGDTFPVITYGSGSGIFNAFNLPSDASWKIKYGPTAFSLIVFKLNPITLTLQVVAPLQDTNFFTLLMLGPIGSNYMIQANTDLNTTDWVTLTNFTTIDTSFYYTDTEAANIPLRFYRAVLIP